MSTKWPDGWVKVPCPNGHEIQSYDNLYEGNISGRCNECGALYMYRFPYNRITGIVVTDVPEVVPIPTDRDGDYNDLPPFPMETDHE